MNKATQGYRAILLDFDGTFADTAPDMVAALNRMRLKRERPEIPLDQARAYVSHGSRALVELGFGDHDTEAKQALVKEFLVTYEEDVASLTRPFQHMENWTRDLVNSGVRWGIVTNKPHYLTVQVLKKLDLATPPQCVVSGDSLLKRKPHPMPVLHAAALLGVPAHQSVYVGDARNDITAGRAAGMYTIGVNYGYIMPEDDPVNWNAHCVVDTVSELMEKTSALIATG